MGEAKRRFKNPAEVKSGAQFTDLGNSFSDLIHAALADGMDVDEVCCVAVAVAADYARDAYGDGYLPDLAKVVLAKAGAKAPADISKN